MRETPSIATAISMPGLAVLLAALFLPCQTPANSPRSALVPTSSLMRLRGLTQEIASTGEKDVVARMRSVLLALGDDPGALDKLSRSWDKSLASARPGKADRAGLAKKLARETKQLESLLPGLDDEHRAQLAGAILQLDSQDEPANAALGNQKEPGGVWVTPERMRWNSGAQKTADLVAAASDLEVNVERADCDNPVIESLCGHANQVSAQGITIDSPISPDKLERILRQALRAIALSNGLLHGQAVVPASLQKHRFVFLDSNERYRPALDEALADHGLTQEHYDEIVKLDERSFADSRGWRTSRWRSEAEYSVLIVWTALDDWMGFDAQPCLRAGHLNWVTLTLLGASIPLMSWHEPAGRDAGDQQTRSIRNAEFEREALLRAARRTLYGCRAWMVRQVLAGKDPQWAQTMLDQEGKIQDELLLKTTLVCEFLQDEGNFWRFVEGTRGKKDRPAACEKALGEPLPALEESWRRWLLPDRSAGVVECLGVAPEGNQASERLDEAVVALNKARTTAMDGQRMEIDRVEMEPELGRAAALHARYLAKNPAQQSKWPDAHEEYSDHEGFTPSGAAAGLRSVIHYRIAPRAAIDSWLGTFYHRLPLLDPGLFGVGLAEEDGVIVMDTSSLVLQPWSDSVVVWPAPDATAVPRAFEPESPNPVPGEDLAKMGFPITIQLFFREQKHEERLTMSLIEGPADRGAEVECVFLSPDTPLFPNLAPDASWCLVPRKTLKAKELYTVNAKWSSGAKVWSFKTGE